MAQRFFSASKTEILPEIEKFRELQAFCSHDLRSQVGAVAGLLQLLEDQLALLDDKTKTSYAAAMTSAQEALENLDATIATTKPNFESVWLIGFTDAEITLMKIDQLLASRPLNRQKPILFLNFETPDEWQTRVRKYRPLAVFFKNREAIGTDAQTWISRLGPQLTKIYFLDASQGSLDGIRPESIKMFDLPADLSQTPQLIFEALEGLPNGR